MNKAFAIITVLVLLITSCSSDSDSNKVALHEQVLKVDINITIAQPDEYPIGMNLNYLRDDDANRYEGARPLTEALIEMGSKFLRYPGGEKSDYHLWSNPPYDKPDPQVFYRPHCTPWGLDCDYPGFARDHDLLDFDEYMEYTKQVGGIPFLVVGASPFCNYDSISMEKYIEVAAEWVRYANIKNNYNIKYWEIGNENWWERLGDHNWYIEMAQKFGSAMKAIDPGIKIGISTSAWGADTAFVKELPEVIDFLSTSGYHGPYWNEYQETPNYDLLPRIRPMWELVDQYAPEGASERMEYFVVEYNIHTGDTTKWADNNDIGHGICLIDMIGQILETDKVTSAMVWNTRWMETEDNVDRTVYTLDNYNQLKPSGKATAIWADAFLDKLVFMQKGNYVRSWASVNMNNSKLNLILINKGNRVEKVSIDIFDANFKEATYKEWTGTNYTDRNPVWKVKRSEKLTGNYLNLNMPAISAMVIELE